MNPESHSAGGLTLAGHQRMILQMYGEVEPEIERRDRCRSCLEYRTAGHE
jgi:hypothetical protein